MVAGPPRAWSRLSMPSPQGEIARYLRTGEHDPIVEQRVLLDTLARSLVFLTPDTIETVLSKEDPGTAWDLANMYLLSCGAKLSQTMRRAAWV
jgi:hypothetical protein